MIVRLVVTLFFPLLMRTVLVSLLPSSAKLRELCFGVLEKASAIQKIKHTYFCTALVFLCIKQGGSHLRGLCCTLLPKMHRHKWEG